MCVQTKQARFILPERWIDIQVFYVGLYYVQFVSFITTLIFLHRGGIGILKIGPLCHLSTYCVCLCVLVCGSGGRESRCNNMGGGREHEGGQIQQ